MDEIDIENKKNKQKIKNNKRRDKNRNYVLEYLSGHPCVDCGETDPVVLEFDHVRDKDKKISDLINYSHNRLKEEILKCEVRCSNCHKRKTSKEQNWYKERYEKNNEKIDSGNTEQGSGNRNLFTITISVESDL